MSSLRKIIHIDMDCFYAAIEVRDNPLLQGKSVAVGGSPDGRGVLCTCNYEARAFGCHSAMPSFQALKKCPDLVLLPVRMDVYKQDSLKVREIFCRYTNKIEPLSLDEAFLDVSHHERYATEIAREIRSIIFDELKLTASAGIAGNKFLAKIASDWRKPNGQFTVMPSEVDLFLQDLPVRKIGGVGKVMEARLSEMKLFTCGDLQQVEHRELVSKFGKFGNVLSELCRGLDSREVETRGASKSVSNENTYRNDLTSEEECLMKLHSLVDDLVSDLNAGKNKERNIHKVFLKMKFNDFTQTTVERIYTQILSVEVYSALLSIAWSRGNGKSVRLIGVGVRFEGVSEGFDAQQMEFWEPFEVGCGS